MGRRVANTIIVGVLQVHSAHRPGSGYAERRHGDVALPRPILRGTRYLIAESEQCQCLGRINDKGAIKEGEVGSGRRKAHTGWVVGGLEGCHDDLGANRCVKNLWGEVEVR